MKDKTSLSNETNEVLEGDYLERRDESSHPSAYELAVEHGFVGTEAEWLASLMGGSIEPPRLSQPPSIAPIVIA